MIGKQRETFDELYMENQSKVYNLALGLSGNPQDAEEITQEAFFRAFRFYETFRGESSFFTWIYRITLNISKDFMKTRTKLPIYALTEDLGYSLEQIVDSNPNSDPETEILANEARYRCLHCLTECMPTFQRQVFCLAITIGLPHKVVAEILERSVSSVKTTLHRAKKRWLGYMEDRCEHIKKSNPCNCKQWVKFGLSQGWFSKQALSNPRNEIMLQAKDEIIELRNLHDTYKNMYNETLDEILVEKIKNGIQKKEWEIIS